MTNAHWNLLIVETPEISAVFYDSFLKSKRIPVIMVLPNEFDASYITRETGRKAEESFDQLAG